MSASRRTLRSTLLDVVAGACLVIAAFHLACVFAPALDPTSSSARHLAFVAINAALAVGFRERPPWFRWVFAALVVQQLASHGALLLASTRAGSPDLPSLLVVVAAPAALALLFLAPRAADRDRFTL